VAGTAPAYLDHVRTMGARNLDVSIYKSFPMGEPRNLRLDVSSYNLTNTAQFGMPNVPSVTDVQTQPSVAATFGQVTNTVNTPRQFQFGARFTFLLGDAPETKRHTEPNHASENKDRLYSGSRCGTAGPSRLAVRVQVNVFPPLVHLLYSSEQPNLYVRTGCCEQQAVSRPKRNE
jgi:hypothetical protein